MIVNGQFHHQGENLLPVDSRAVRYGDGCFETLRSYQGKFFKLESHLERLRQGLKYLQIQSPFKIRSDEVKEKLRVLIEKNKLTEKDAVVRLQVWRTGERGYSISEDAGAGYCISVSPLPNLPASVSLATVSTRRIPAEAVNPKYKLSNSINYIRAASEAAARQADDALLQTVEGYISETTIANIFWVNNDTVFTPSEECDILPGITRNILCNIIQQELDISVVKGAFRPNELQNAKAAWICNSVREIVEIRSLDGHQYARKHPFFSELKKAFNSYKNKELN